MELKAKAKFTNVLKAKAVFERVNVVSGDIDAINTALDAVNEEEIGTTPAEKITFIDGWKEDIKAAITAKGVDMTDVVPDDYDTKIAEISGATGDATVNQVLAGATFSNAIASDLTGTMPNVGKEDFTPSTANQAISEGYHDGTGVIAGDADLIADNIKKDASIFGVVGSFEGDFSAIKADLDAANEEISADVDAAVALVDSNYAAIKAAIEAKDVDMSGVKPSGYDEKIATIAGPTGDAVAADLLAGKTASTAAGAITGTRPCITVAKTGQTTSYATGDDGDIEAGYACAGDRFTDNEDGTITDNSTGLMWLADNNSISTKSWADALDYCNALDFAAYTDWRLPNLLEAASIRTPGTNNLCLPAGHPFSIVGGNYWSSNTQSNATTSAFYFSTNLFLQTTTAKSGALHVWPVRGPIAL